MKVSNSIELVFQGKLPKAIIANDNIYSDTPLSQKCMYYNFILRLFMS